MSDRSHLGPAKLIGVLALLQHRGPTLEEWAYAGFTIELIGATASLAFANSSIGAGYLPFLFLLSLSASYALRHDRQRAANVWSPITRRA